MEIYTVDRQFRLDDIVEDYESAIWTERYSSYGDVKLKLAYSPEIQESLVEGTFLACNESDEVMMVETHELEDGLLTVSGISLVGFLKNRMLRQGWSTVNKTWAITGAPGWIAGEIVREMCMPGGLITATTTTGPLADGSKELIPNLAIGDTATGTTVTIAVEYGDVYGGVAAVCNAYDLGFWLRPYNITTDGDYDLIFSSYAGKDRTSDQTTNPLVQFSPSLDSLVKTSELRSIAAYKNVAYAYASNITPSPNVRVVGIAYADPSDIDKAGFDRRSLYLDVSDITYGTGADAPNNTVLASLLTQRAIDALANNNYVRMVDGQIVPQGGFAYGSDYYLGDIIELRSVSGALSKARVIEYIRTKDGTGESAYPTLSVITD